MVAGASVLAPIRPGLRSVILSTLLAAASALPLLAGTTGGVSGVVTDDKGLPLEGATVVVDSAAQTILGRGSLTDTEGRFQVGALPPGSDYHLTVTFPGFANVGLMDIEVNSGQITLVRITLQKLSSSLQEHVQVKASPPLVTLLDNTTQARFTSEFIDSLPLLGRNYQDLLAMAPGVSDVDGDGNPNIHGARDTDVITLVDGVSTTDPLTGKVGAQLNIESIQEIEVKTSGATAEFSRAQGGFANIITKSGGNQFETTLKFYYRGSTLDGDGAGIDSPRLHGGLGERGLRDLKFNDYLPFLSISGPIVKDKAWFFSASEFVQIQTPVNALNEAFVTGQREVREFAKLTWQATPNQRFALSLNYDPQEFTNQGLTSFTREESGYTLRQGGPVITAKWVGILSPTASLETSLSQFDERPSRTPTIDPDTNHNGVLWTDRNHNGFPEVSEFDSGEDFDNDGEFDIFEDTNRNGLKDPGEDDLHGDNDGLLTAPGPHGGCEGVHREDLDCDGRLDTFNEDVNHNGILDPGEDIDHDGYLDLGNEDRNGNGLLDDRPVPAKNLVPDGHGGLTTLYPYGELAPLPADRLYTIDQKRGITSGPYYSDFSDRRDRSTFRQDLTLFVPDFLGSHDLKTGVVVEREGFHRLADGRPIVAPIVRGLREGPSTVRTIVPAESEVQNSANSLNGGTYAQDAWKPFPNLSIGLGLRFDREATDSTGYTFFDPVAQRAQFDRLNGLIGGERPDQDDLLQGNNDGIHSLGITADPFFYSVANPTKTESTWTDPVRVAALSRMTRHHIETSFASQQLGALFPELSGGGDITASTLQSLGIQPQREEPFRLTNNNLSPRISVAWDPASSGRTKLFATWGRYYDKLFLNTIVGEEGPDDINRYYLLDLAGVTGSGLPDHQIGQVVSKSPPSTTQIDRALQTPWSDEFTVGFERELAPEVALTLTFIARDYRQQLQDIDVNHTLRYDPNTGQPLDAFGLLPSGFSTTGKATDRQADGKPDLYVENFFFNQVLRIGNFNEARYRGIELQAVRRLARRWEMQGSYTYSRATGQAEDFQSSLGNDPSTVESEHGYLDFDQRHVVKVNASLFLPHDWQMGLSASWQSGLPYSVITRFFALDNADYLQFRTRFGQEVGNVFVTEPRNDHRNAATYNIGARAHKSFVLGRATAGAFVEVFNLLNTDDLHIISYEPTPPQLQTPGQSTQGPLQLNGTRQFGRRWQVGFQVDF